MPIRLFVLATVALLTSPCAAQHVVVKKKPVDGALPAGRKPVYDQWFVSFSRNANPSVYELDAIVATEAQAMKRVKALTEWSKTIEGRSWKLHTIEVEADFKLEEAKKAEADAASQLNKKPNRKVGDVLKEYKKTIQAAYRRTADLKKDLVGRTGTIRESSFKDVNDQIDSFNRMREDGYQETGYYVASAPRIPVVSENELNARLVPDQEPVEQAATEPPPVTIPEASPAAPAADGRKGWYHLWTDGEEGFGGETAEEAVKLARWMKEHNPSYSYKVIGPDYNNSFDNVPEGEVILDLP